MLHDQQNAVAGEWMARWLPLAWFSVAVGSTLSGLVLQAMTPTDGPAITFANLYRWVLGWLCFHGHARTRRSGNSPNRFAEGEALSFSQCTGRNTGPAGSLDRSNPGHPSLERQRLAVDRHFHDHGGRRPDPAFGDPLVQKTIGAQARAARR